MTFTRESICGFVVLLAIVVGCDAPATATPSPTVTPVPTASTSVPPCPTPAEATYLDDLDDGVRSWGTLMMMYGERLQKGTLSLALIDDSWLSGTETDIYVLQSLSDKIIELQGPSSTNHLDTVVERAMLLAKEILDLQWDGLTTKDPSKLLESEAKSQTLTYDVEFIRGYLDTFCVGKAGSGG